VFISYAHNFEDVMLWRALGQVTKGFYIDIGACYPVLGSVSLAFYERGWRGVHVEPSPTLAEMLRQARPDETVIQAAVDSRESLLKFYEILENIGLSTGEAEIAETHRAAGLSPREIDVPSLTLASLLDRYADREIHWLKIDVEGMEKRVIESWKPSKVRPWILVVESTYPMTQVKTHQDWEPMVLSLGYKFVYFDGLNRFYVSKAHRELKDTFKFGPNVFDDFNPDATSFFCQFVNERHRSELTAIRLELEKQEQEQGAGVARERDLAQAVVQSKQDLEGLLRHVAAREREIGEHLLKINQDAQEELRRLEQEGAARERDLTQAALQSKQDLEGLLRHVAAREREIGEKLIAGQRKLLNLEQEWAQAEKALNQEITGLQREIQALNHSQQLRAQQHGFELATKQDELNRLIQTFADLEAQLKAQILSEQQTSLQFRQTIAEVEKNLAKTHASLSWRMTAPLRQIASFIAPRKGHGPSSSSPKPAAPPPVIETTVSESQPTSVLPASQAAMKPLMLPSAPAINLDGPAIAATLDELLTRHDQAFVHCAYQTLLGRDPDADGLNYYLARLRSGIPKIQILGQLRRSEEGRDYAANLPRLDAAIRRYRWAHKAIIGWLVRLFVRVEGNNATERELRGLEGQIFLLVDENIRRFNQMEKALTGLHHQLADQLEQINAVVGVEGGTAQVPIRPFGPKDLKQLSPCDTTGNLLTMLQSQETIGSHTAGIFTAIKDAISTASRCTHENSN